MKDLPFKIIFSNRTESTLNNDLRFIMSKLLTNRLFSELDLLIHIMF